MCILIYKPADVELPEVMITNSASANPHGWGYASIVDGAIRTAKGLSFYKDRFEDGRSPMEVIRSLTPYESIVHFRITSRGATSLENTHPIWTGNGQIYMAHNGTINGWGDGYGEGRSDTFELAQAVGESLPPEFPVPEEHGVWKIVRKILGLSNKVALISPAGVRIFGREQGVEHDDGIWTSNRSCFWAPYAKSATTKSTYDPLYSRDGKILSKRDKTREAGAYSLPIRLGNKRAVCSVCGDCDHQNCAEFLSLRCDPHRFHICWCTLNAHHANYCKGLRSYSQKGDVIKCLDCAAHDEVLEGATT